MFLKKTDVQRKQWYGYVLLFPCPYRVPECVFQYFQEAAAMTLYSRFGALSRRQAIVYIAAHVRPECSWKSPFNRETCEPAKQQTVINFLHQLTLASDRMERHQ